MRLIGEARNLKLNVLNERVRRQVDFKKKKKREKGGSTAESMGGRPRVAVDRKERER